MIVRMRALSAVLHSRDRDALLSALQGAGVVHVTEKADRDTSAFFKRLETARELDRILKSLDAGATGASACGGQKSGKTAEDVIAEYRDGVARRESLEQSIARFEKDEARLLPYGDFNPDHVRAPDVAFISRPRLERLGEIEGFWPGAPDLVVEVVSPGDTYAEVEDKVFDWLDAGCRMVVVVNARKRAVTVYRSPSQIAVLGPTDILDGADVVPGWQLPIAQLFA